MDQEGVDTGSPRRPECLPQDLMRPFEIAIAHHVGVAVQIAVADGRDDDISDLAMINAGYLMCGLRSHVGAPWRIGGNGEVLSGADRSGEMAGKNCIASKNGPSNPVETIASTIGSSAVAGS